MKLMKFVQGAMVALAAVGVVCPQLPVMAAGQKATVKTVAANTILDIGLAQGGTLTGRVVDQSGVALEGAEVVVKQGKTEVTRTITDKQGTFVAKDLKGGVYTVASGSTEGTYRTWSEKTAPPAAHDQALLVVGKNGARGQCGSCDSGGFGGFGGVGSILLVGGLIAGGVGLGYALGHAAGTPNSP